MSKQVCSFFVHYLQVDRFGNIDSSTVAIDANPTSNHEEQYRRHKLSRELKKAFVGFQQCRKKHEAVNTTEGGV